MKTQTLIQAARRTVRISAREAVSIGKKVKAVAERHPGVLVGAAVGHAVGRTIERIPGTQVLGVLPRCTGVVLGASLGYVMGKAVAEVLEEERFRELRRAATCPAGNGTIHSRPC